ncbi:MAG TPA: hypothetical protein ENF41_00635 [Candidatus Bathyarchaeota archaeon]|nr:hypothetical protein [Candidatus Bathyarchaeota archaeon]
MIPQRIELVINDIRIGFTDRLEEVNRAIDTIEKEYQEKDPHIIDFVRGVYLEFLKYIEKEFNLRRHGEC